MGFSGWRALNAKSLGPELRGEICRFKGEDFGSPSLSWVIKNRIPVEGVYSFRKSIAERRLWRRDFRSRFTEWALNDKIVGLRFASALNVEVPKTFAEHAPLSTIEQLEIEGRVLKPSFGSGSQGVHLIFSRDRAISLSAKKGVSSEQMFNELRSRVASGALRDKFNLEEMVLDADGLTQARDLKFYCFYGVCGLVLEIVRGPKTRYCFYDRSGEIVDTGRYSGSTFRGEGFTEDQVKLAEMVSSEVPAPFLRIDFLRASEKKRAGMVFGEVTPVPGGYETFNEGFDVQLGRMWAEAEVRLFNDLMEGKEFENFRAVLRR